MPDHVKPNQAATKLAHDRYFRSARFLTSAATFSQCPPDTGAEIAFAGRSNAGKSSAINCITDNRKLAKTSKTPGRTQLINFFELSDGCRLVDLPGYGFAKVAEKKKLAWQKLMENYLEHRQSLRALVLLIDSRHPLQPIDEVMLNWAAQYDMPCHILLTKADKLSGNGKQNTMRETQKIANLAPACSFALFSAVSNLGLQKLHETLSNQLKSGLIS